MLAKVSSAATLGIDAVRITVEVDAVAGMPKFIMVGLPDLAVREAYSRVYSALHNCGFWWPARRSGARSVCPLFPPLPHLRFRVAAPPHHGDPLAGRREERGLGLRPADR